MEYLFMLAGSFALLFSIIILSDKTKRSHHWMLAAMLILIIINCFFIFNVFRSNGSYYLFFFSELNYAIPLLYSVLLYFYAKSLTQKDFTWRLIDGMHFLPFLNFFIFLLLSNEGLKNNGFPFIKLLVTPCYILATLVVLKRYRNRLRAHYSSIDHMYLYWLSWVTFGALALWIVACAGNIANYFNDYDGAVLGDYFLTSFLGLFLFTLAYVGFNRTHIFQSASYKELLPPIQPESTTETHVSDELNVLFQSLEDYMITKKPYLEPTLSLRDLADQIKVSSTKLSNAINAHTDSHFFDYINSYRVQLVQEKLISEDLNTYSILGIANECGFQSKATFNRIFKKKTGMTPTAFIKKNKQS